MINTSYSFEDINKISKEGMISHLGIEFTDIGIDFICGKMPVDARTKQPFGLLHGGASVTLAETLGSFGSYCCIDIQRQYVVGLEINANHIRAAKEGFVYGRATLIHCGKKTHIWEIKIVNEKQELVCASRLTMAVLDKI